jgi:hypothetical protein
MAGANSMLVGAMGGLNRAPCFSVAGHVVVTPVHGAILRPPAAPGCKRALNLTDPGGIVGRFCHLGGPAPQARACEATLTIRKRGALGRLPANIAIRC